MFTIRFQVYRVNQQMSRKEIRQPWKLFVLILMDTVVFLVRKAVVMISNNYTFIEIKALTTYTVRQFNNRKTKKITELKWSETAFAACTSRLFYSQLVYYRWRFAAVLLSWDVSIKLMFHYRFVSLSKMFTLYSDRKIISNELYTKIW